jgi:putative ATP-dependent endonuclease of the OLD family
MCSLNYAIDSKMKFLMGGWNLKLKTVVLKNFRAYKKEIRVNISDFTAFIGKNDVGKSTILEALDIFFNGTNGIVKFDRLDANVNSEEKKVVIGCVFTDLPKKIVLDTLSQTTLEEEYLLNEDGDLEIHKVFDCTLKTPRENVFVVANHPTRDEVKDLLELSNSELKTRAKDMGIDLSEIDQRSNSALRFAIRNNIGELNIQKTKVQLNKHIWDSIAKVLPHFALFQADRTSKDGDSEVQDPMKVAISEAIKSVQDKLSEVKEIVKKQAEEVANRTLKMLQEMNPDLAKELVPNFKEPKWESVFKLCLVGDNDIPINKRGSGARRIILLSFFRAEAERRQQEEGGSGIIYAIEEPETAQHPEYQKVLVDALKSLAQQSNCQVIITTHVPSLAGLLPIETLRYIDVDKDGERRVREGDSEVYAEIADQLGVLPDRRVKLFVCVEGPHDVSFLEHISRLLHTQDNGIPVLGDIAVNELKGDPRVVVFPLGGSILSKWVNKRYLSAFGIPEVHIYDSDNGNNPKYLKAAEKVNKREDGSKAFLTRKREMENYLHPDAIYEVFGVRVNFTDEDDVVNIVHNALILEGAKEHNKDKIKNKLNNVVASKMTLERLRERDPDGEIYEWFKLIASMISDEESVEC